MTYVKKYVYGLHVGANLSALISRELLIRGQEIRKMIVLHCKKRKEGLAKHVIVIPCNPLTLLESDRTPMG
jgi:hypothetical protein